MTQRSDSRKLSADLGNAALGERKRRQALENLAAETVAEFHEVEDVIEDLEQLLSTAEMARTLGDISSPRNDPGSLAEAVVMLAEILLRISRADFKSGYLSQLKTPAKDHLKKLTVIRDSWPKLKAQNDTRHVNKAISAAYKDLIKSLHKIHKTLGKEARSLNKDLRKNA